MTRRAVGDYYENEDGSRRVSVTTVLKVIDKPFVDKWTVNTEREYVIDASADLYCDLPLDCQRMSRMAYVETLRHRLGKTKAHQKASLEATAIGDAAHRRVEWELRRRLGKARRRPEPVCTGEALWAYQEWEKWWDGCGLEPVAIEQEVWSEVHGYQGTADLLAKDTAGELVLVDLKTSKAVYQEYELQVAAYAHAVNEMGLGPCGKGLIVRLPKHANDPGFETKEIESFGDIFPVFLNALELWKWQEQHAAAYREKKAKRSEAA